MKERKLDNGILKTAIYVRVSTDIQAEEGYSIEFQTSSLRSFCDAKGYGNIELYEDSGWSGSNLERPGIQRLILDCNNGEIERVLVYKLDRLSRSQKDTLFLIEDVFLMHGVDFQSISENFDTSTPIGMVFAGLLSTFAQFERSRILERTQSGMIQRVKDGYWPGGARTPFGYDYNPKQGILIPNRDADTVRKIFEMYINGASTYKICATLGLKYDRLAMQILQRKTYLGLICYNGVEYPGRHEAIISAETYNRAMSEMKRRSRHPSYSESQYLLTGLLVCGYCGAKMRYQKYANGVKIYCYSRHKSKAHLVKDPDCKNESYDAAMVEKRVMEYIFQFFLSREATETNKEKLPVYRLEDEIKRQIALTELKIKRLYALYAEDGNELLLDTIQEQRATLKELEDRLAVEAMKESSDELETSRLFDVLCNLEGSWQYLSFNEKQNIIRSAVERVILLHDRVEVCFSREILNFLREEAH